MVYSWQSQQSLHDRMKLIKHLNFSDFHDTTSFHADIIQHSIFVK